MRVSREKAAENRERIIDAAGALFRAKGFAGIGVADIMKAADLTHGGFYGHFASKDDLAAQASRRSTGALRRQVGARCRRVRPKSAYAALLANYLTPRTATIPVAAAPLPRSAPMPRAAARRSARRSPTACSPSSTFLPKSVPGRTKAARRRKAVAAMAALVGAVTLARAVGDPAFVGRNYRGGTSGTAGGRRPLSARFCRDSLGFVL